ncbi:MAG: TerC/Alx family metal homeostasis membrane protein [Gemmatimonadaceae bacterium]|nr:TerC/Alx family metal homeostasis membrane protein [Gemmatimonadaceae bacterium]
MQHTWMWSAFGIIVAVMLALDLGVFHRKAHSVRPREALIWSIVWVSLATSFGIGLWFFDGHQTALEFAAGYVVEQALSVDNLFVFLLLFGYFKVPDALQHRVLFWGIMGALIMRAVMIGAGAVLLERFHWIIYLFGAFLVFTGIKMLVQQDSEMEPERNPILKLVRRLVPVTDHFEGDRFFTRAPWGADRVMRTVATPLFVVLVLVETTVPRLRGGLHSGGVRCHARSVRGLHVERVRDSRPALALLPAGGGRAQVLAAQAGSLARVAVRRRQDAGERVLSRPDGRVAAGDHHDSCRVRRAVAALPEVGARADRAG